MEAFLKVEPHLEVADLREWVTCEELALSVDYAPRRRREYLTWRAVVRRELGQEVEIDYDEVGAPYVKESSVKISVSHTSDKVVVAFSERPCAVDMESLKRNFQRIAPHYLREEEGNLSHDENYLAVAWCVKETLYKYAHKKALDLKDDLHIESVDWSKGKVWGRIEEGKQIEITFEIRDTYCLTYIL